jgi:hypothetical protein
MSGGSGVDGSLNGYGIERYTVPFGAKFRRIDYCSTRWSRASEDRDD